MNVNQAGNKPNFRMEMLNPDTIKATKLVRHGFLKLKPFYANNTV